MNVPQCLPKASYIHYKSEIDQAIQRVCDNGWYILGKEVEAFEEEFANYLGVAHTVGVANGTDAIVLALRAVGIQPGDGVITVSHTAVATVAAIEVIGAVPVLVDIARPSYTLDVTQLEDVIRKLSSSLPIKAIVPVHIYGHPADMKGIMAVAEKHGLQVVEDCSQAHGARLDGQRVGTFGSMATFSFYPTKNLGALGDGGAVATRDASLADRVRSLRQYGWKERYVSNEPGINSRLDEMQAAILRVKLKYLDDDNQRRCDVASRYNHSLKGVYIQLPQVTSLVEHVYHQYVIESNCRDEISAFLAAQQVGTNIHYPVPVHLQTAYQGRLLCPDPLSVTEQVMSRILSLPMQPELTEEQVDHVIVSLNSFQKPS